MRIRKVLKKNFFTNEIDDNFTSQFDRLFLIFDDTMRDGVHYRKLKNRASLIF